MTKYIEQVEQSMRLYRLSALLCFGLAFMFAGLFVVSYKQNKKLEKRLNICTQVSQRLLDHQSFEGIEWGQE